MRIIVFTFIRYSHIFPMMSFFKTICKNIENEITIFCKEEYSYLFSDLRCTVVFYHEGYMNTYTHEDMQKNIEEKNKIIQRQFVKEYNDGNSAILLQKKFMKNHFLQQVLGMLNEKTEILEKYEEIIRKIGPDLIIRDSIEMIGLYYAQKYESKIYTYITNNIYSLEMLDSEEYESFSQYFQLIESEEKISKDLRTYYINAVKEAYDDASVLLDNPSIYPAFQQAPKENYVFICSAPSLHPVLSGLKKNKYVFLGNSFELFEIEKDKINIDEKIFIQSVDKKLVYLSYGSYMMVEPSVIVGVIKMIYSRGYALVVSCPKGLLAEIKILLGIYNREEIFLKEGVYQHYILSHVDAFFTSGGWNSIKEAIFFQVPMYIMPSFSEQNMNGLFVEQHGLGVTEYRKRDEILMENELIEFFLKNIKTYQKNIRNIKGELLDCVFPDYEINKIFGNESK